MGPEGFGLRWFEGFPVSASHDPSFVALFVSNQRRIHGYILTVVPDCNEADDLFQQTSMVLWEKAAESRPEGDFVRWACGIAHNIIRNYRVKKRRDRHCFSDEMMARLAEVRAEKSEWLEGALASLGECMGELAPLDRELVTLCYDGHRSIRQISESLSKTENAVYQHLHRIRAKLLDCIEEKNRKEPLP
jgi:RNA polymerase sigma-70 factor, ECF subfamily